MVGAALSGRLGPAGLSLCSCAVCRPALCSLPACAARPQPRPQRQAASALAATHQARRGPPSTPCTPQALAYHMASGAYTSDMLQTGLKLPTLLSPNATIVVRAARRRGAKRLLFVLRRGALAPGSGAGRDIEPTSPGTTTCKPNLQAQSRQPPAGSPPPCWLTRPRCLPASWRVARAARGGGQRPVCGGDVPDLQVWHPRARDGAQHQVARLPVRHPHCRRGAGEWLELITLSGGAASNRLSLGTQGRAGRGAPRCGRRTSSAPAGRREGC